MKKEFQPKKYQFENGVIVDINEDKITVAINNDKKTMNAENIDNFGYQEYYEPMLAPSTLLFWIIGASLLY